MFVEKPWTVEIISVSVSVIVGNAIPARIKQMLRAHVDKRPSLFRVVERNRRENRVATNNACKWPCPAGFCLSRQISIVRLEKLRIAIIANVNRICVILMNVQVVSRHAIYPYRDAHMSVRPFATIPCSWKNRPMHRTRHGGWKRKRKSWEKRYHVHLAKSQLQCSVTVNIKWGFAPLQKYLI